jgi:hypothetical protein
MRRHGFLSWPPIWKPVSGEGRILTGEPGILKEARLTVGTLTRIFCIIEHERRLYMGAVLLLDEPFARQVQELLQLHLDQPIKEIGDLDVRHLL